MRNAGSHAAFARYPLFNAFNRFLSLANDVAASQIPRIRLSSQPVTAKEPLTTFGR